MTPPRLQRAPRPALLALAVAAASSVPVRSDPAIPGLIDCTTIPRNAGAAALARRFGNGSVRTVQLDGAEGQPERGTSVFPGESARRLDVFWSDAAHLRSTASVVIHDRSRWRVRVPGGATLGLGASLREVEVANGRPFSISGFFWDQGGYATDWRGGALPTLPGGCTLSVRFSPDPKVDGKAADRASGEASFSSSDAAIRALAPTVSVLSLDWGG